MGVLRAPQPAVVCCNKNEMKPEFVVVAITTEWPWYEQKV